MFSLSTSCREEEKTPETTEEAVVEEEAEPIKMSRRRRRFHDWVNGAGAKYSRPSKGTTNYLGSSTVSISPGLFFNIETKYLFQIAFPQ